MNIKHIIKMSAFWKIPVTIYSRVSHLEVVKVRRKSGSACLLMSLKLRGHGRKIHIVSVLFVGMTFRNLQI